MFANNFKRLYSQTVQDRRLSIASLPIHNSKIIFMIFLAESIVYCNGNRINVNGRHNPCPHRDSLGLRNRLIPL